MNKFKLLNWIDKNKKKIEEFSDEIYPYAPLDEKEYEKEVLSSLFEEIEDFKHMNLVDRLVEYLNIYFLGKELEDEELRYKFLFGMENLILDEIKNLNISEIEVENIYNNDFQDEMNFKYIENLTKTFNDIRKKLKQKYNRDINYLSFINDIELFLAFYHGYSSDEQVKAIEYLIKNKEYFLLELIEKEGLPANLPEKYFIFFWK